MRFKEGDVVVSLGEAELTECLKEEKEFIWFALPKGLVTEVASISRMGDVYIKTTTNVSGVVLFDDELSVIRHATQQEEFLYIINFREPFILENEESCPSGKGPGC